MGGKGLRISDDAVRAATDRGWDEWESYLDEAGAAGLAHPEIVRLLEERAGVRSGWWRQTVANGYEKLKGKRVTGETAGTGFQVGAQRTVAIPLARAWALLTSPEGIRTWLGGPGEVGLEEGETYGLGDGSKGEVRVVRPEDRLRLTRQPGGWPRASTIQVWVEAKGGRTVIGFHEEHLPGAEERERRRTHFREALDALQEMGEADA